MRKPIKHTKSKQSKRRIIIPYNPILKEYARYLRNNSTPSEIKLWLGLKGKFDGKYDFHRQKPLDQFIADFFCYELMLVIELDGSSHNSPEAQARDLNKEIRLNQLGINVLRFVNDNVDSFMADTLEVIREYIEGWEKGDLSFFERVNTPLNRLSRGDFHVPS